MTVAEAIQERIDSLNKEIDDLGDFGPQDMEECVLYSQIKNELDFLNCLLEKIKKPENS